MAIGPGKYDAQCTQVREAVHARGVLVIVIDGTQGSGFSAQGDAETLVSVPEVLEAVAADIRRERGARTTRPDGGGGDEGERHGRDG